MPKDLDLGSLSALSINEPLPEPGCLHDLLKACTNF